jgi:hypothetical protein
MDDNIAIVYDDPAVAGEALQFSLFSVFGTNVVDDSFCERVHHSVAGTGANDEIVSKRDDLFNVQQNDVFPFFVFKGVYDFACEF